MAHESCLPDRKLLRLQEATTFAFYGLAFSRHTHSLDDLERFYKDFTELAYPSIYSRIDRSNSCEFNKAHRDFDLALSDAGLAGNVIFYVVIGGELKAVPEGYFIRPRGFSTLDDRIQATPWGAPIGALLDDENGAHLDNVLISRGEYQAWLAKCYPQIFGGQHGEINEKNLDRMGAIEDIARHSEPAPSSQRIALIEVINELWPNGVPTRAKLSAKERDDIIKRAMQAKSYRLPLEQKSLETAIQRALRDIRNDKGDKGDR